MLPGKSVVAWLINRLGLSAPGRSAEVVGLRMLCIVKRSEQAFALEKLQLPGERTDFKIYYLKIDRAVAALTLV